MKTDNDVKITSEEILPYLEYCEHLARNLHKYLARRSVDGLSVPVFAWTKEDIAQELLIRCWQTLQKIKMGKYTPKEGKAPEYVRMSIKNKEKELMLQLKPKKAGFKEKHDDSSMIFEGNYEGSDE